MIIKVSNVEGFTGDVYDDLTDRFPEARIVHIDARYEGLTTRKSCKQFFVKLIDAPPGLRRHHVNGILHQHSLRAPSITETLLFLLEHADNSELMSSIIHERTILFFHKLVTSFYGNPPHKNLHRVYLAETVVPSYATCICFNKVDGRTNISLFDTRGCIEPPMTSNTPYLLAGVRM